MSLISAPCCSPLLQRADGEVREHEHRDCRKKGIVGEIEGTAKGWEVDVWQGKKVWKDERCEGDPVRKGEKVSSCEVKLYLKSQCDGMYHVFLFYPYGAAYGGC